eukprot:TRINITY_DN16036_c0_g1_i24.p1 TRINITY_DN16036_c0_g1~~TRINITY_DN16036_c0_g1_i24.p1  ORF type:complete len:156 (+),score=15.93 TRINITY_DN16036_c0_g1_i24:169-636(+)
MWNTTSFQCIQTLADGDPVARYIDSKVPSRGIIIEYVGETTTTQIEIECDRRFERPKLVRVGLIAYRPNVYKFWFKCNYVCRNAPTPVPESSKLPYLLALLFFACVLCIVIGVCMYYNATEYMSSPCTECWLKLKFKTKQIFNNLIGYTTPMDEI